MDDQDTAMETNTRIIEELGTSVKVMQTAIEERLPLPAIQRLGPRQEVPLLGAEIVVQPVQHEVGVLIPKPIKLELPRLDF